MNCPYCNKEMEKGEVQVGSFLDAKLFKGGNVIWIPEKDSKKMIPKNTINLYGIAEGYYCNQCIKVVAIFEDRGADFLQ